MYKIDIIHDDRGKEAILMIDFCKVLEKFGCMRSNNRQDMRFIVDEYGYLDQANELKVKAEKEELKRNEYSQQNSRNLSASHANASVNEVSRADDGYGGD